MLHSLIGLHSREAEILEVKSEVSITILDNSGPVLLSSNVSVFTYIFVKGQLYCRHRFLTPGNLESYVTSKKICSFLFAYIDSWNLRFWVVQGWRSLLLSNGNSYWAWQGALWSHEFSLFEITYLSCLLQITYISPNEAELVAMAEALYHDLKQEKHLLDDEVPDDRKLSEPAASLWRMRHCIRTLLDTGLDYIILTLGSYGAVLCSLSSTSSQNLRWGFLAFLSSFYPLQCSIMAVVGFH